MSGLLPTYKGYVSVGECDEMGHMNIQFYIAKTSDSSFHLRAALGLGQRQTPPSPTSYVALEHHIRFHGELRTSDLVSVDAGILDIRPKTMRIYQEMRNCLTGKLAATIVVDVGHFDLQARKLVPWREDSLRRAEDLRTSLPEAARPRSLGDGSLDRNVSVERADALNLTETNRSAVNGWECDSNGHMNARFYMARFSDCQGHMWAQAGLDRHMQMARNLATATVEMRLGYFNELHSGDTLYVRTGIVGVASRTVHYRHWMFNGETHEPVAAAEGVALLIDRTTRKAVSLPAEIADRFN